VLDEASAAQLIRANPGGSGPSAGRDDGFAFTHDKIREVLYQELNPIRRRRLHQRIGETLETLYGAPRDDGEPAAARSDEHAQDLAHHFMHAGDLSKSLTYSRRAAANAERVFAHDEVLEFLVQARESAEALHRAIDLHAIDEAIGDIHETRGTTHPAVESFQQALAGATTPEARARLKAKIGNVYCAVGDPRGLPYLEEALAELDPRTQTHALALVTALMGRYYHWRERRLRWASARRSLARLRRVTSSLGRTRPDADIGTMRSPSARRITTKGASPARWRASRGASSALHKPCTARASW